MQAEQQEEALAACYQETYTNGSKAKRILLPVRHLQQWIEHNILLELAAAPFSKDDAQLVPEAGSCLDCPKRTGHNTLLFAEIGTDQPDSCTDPKCYAAKLDAHVKQTVAAKPKLVQISTAYGQPKDGSAAIPRNKYVEIRQDKPQTQEAARLAGIQDVQVHHRGHRHRRHREGRNRNGFAPIPNARSITRRSSNSGHTPMLHSRPNRRSAAARRRWPRPPDCAS